ncbi:hypothetical protein PLESTB_000026400 [Pleodorina starrii]|uniref:DUF7880 domain-containing protein n=1 Tax=Pleodorina starrii TaxID=330485 RepID=A0A9W6B8W3_9CHLO|nr:hypothetical protein PLESTM_001108200 [Pleodorina starrii]GLC47794.1 hypothetical protein PLESTB_000026400 [Pleodorina starrii]GLC70783.1 hypothetical protein PLESTF_001032800 [Pleodorina starrii]
MAAATQLLRPCALQRAAAPFQRTTQNSAVGQAGPGPGSTSSPAVVPPSSSCISPAKAPRLQTPTLDRRDVLLLSSSLVVSHLAQLTGSSPAHAAGQGLNRYIRRKTLDPLETYVPLVLEARGVLSQAKSLAAKDVGAARELLRQGPFSGLRDNVRAIGEYAARDGRTTEVGPLVTGFFKALESYDQLLYDCLREKTFPKPEDVDARIQELYTAFDRLLATVPPEILERANRVLEVAAAKAAEGMSDASTSAAGAAASGSAGAPVVDDEAAELVMLLR